MRHSLSRIVALTNTVYQIHQIERRTVNREGSARPKGEIDGCARSRQIIQFLKGGVRVRGHQLGTRETPERPRQQKHPDKSDRRRISEFLPHEPGDVEEDPTPCSTAERC